MTSSTSGMMDSVRTSELLKFRAEHVVPRRIVEMEDAIEQRDFGKFAELTMRDSNQFHATCLDTFPPIAYMTDASHAICRLVHRVNADAATAAAAGDADAETLCAYTFDAGPNAVIFVLERNVPAVMAAVLGEFGPAQAAEGGFVQGESVATVDEVLAKHPVEEAKDGFRGAIKYVIHTKVGPGATFI